MSSGAKTSNDFGGCFLAGKLAKEFFDVLNLERPLLEIVLSDVILHGEGRHCTSAQRGEALGSIRRSPKEASIPGAAGRRVYWRRSILAQVSRSDTVRLKIMAPGADAGSTQKYPIRSNWKCVKAGAVASPGSA